MKQPAGRLADLRCYGRVIWRRKGFVLLVMVLTFAGAAVALHSVPDVYESEVVMEFQRLFSDANGILTDPPIPLGDPSEIRSSGAGPSSRARLIPTSPGSGWQC